MGDSVRPDSIPLTVSIAATYANGRYAVTDAAVAARFPRARYGWCRIDVTGTLADAADVLDVEAGDATPATANLWVQSWHVLRRPGLPVLYVNRANMPQVIKACQSGGSEPGRDYGLWVATLDGTPQWSRPSIGRMTGLGALYLVGTQGPQWSRPSIGRMTAVTSRRPHSRCSPQWSRPSIGRMTPRERLRYLHADGAAMEPAEYRPDDRQGRASR